MPTIKNVDLEIVKDFANANITLKYDIEWTAFEQLTNLEFDETYRFVGDDTGQDGDDGAVGDDSINLGPMIVARVASNGQAVTQRTKSKTFAFDKLDEDTALGAANNDDEIRAVVTLKPLLPVEVSKESDLVTVTA